MAASLFRNVMVWDGGDSTWPGEVLVEGKSIAAVARGRNQIDGARAESQIDGHGMTLMPGMVEGHCHLSFTNVGMPYELGQIPPEEHLLATMRAATMLFERGFTSIYSAASAKLRLDVVTRNEINAGRWVGPRLRASTPEITVTAGLGDERLAHINRESFALVADGPDEIRKVCRMCAREGVDNMKINISGDEFVSHARAEITSMTEAEVAAAVETAHDFGKRIACHARAAESVKRAVRNGVDVIYHCDFADEEALDMLESVKDRIFVGPAVGLVHNCVYEGEAVGITPEVCESMGLYRKFERCCETYHEMRRRGIRVVIGGDYGFSVTPQGTNARDIGHFVKFFGYSPAEALRCATAVGGELMDMAGELGQLREGWLADLVLVDGNPLSDVTMMADPSRFALVMKDGVVYRDARAELASFARVAAE